MALIEQLCAELEALSPHELYLLQTRVDSVLGTAKRELTPEEKATRAVEALKEWEHHNKVLDTPGSGTREQTLAWIGILRDARAKYEEMTGIRLQSRHI